MPRRTAHTALASTSDACCACVELSGAAAPPAIEAFFCGYFPGAEKGAAAARCEGFNNTTSDPGLLCTGAGATNCSASLEAANVACPAAAGAPTVSTGALAALVVLLGAGGYLRTRRRAAAPPV